VVTGTDYQTRRSNALTQARQGDRSAFSRVVEPYRRELIAYCYRHVGSLPEAEDLAQETFVRAYRAMGGFEGRASARAWLYRIAHNLCINHVQRDRQPWESLDDAATDSSSAVVVAAEATGQDREDVRLGFVALLRSLPPRQRAALVLRDVLGWSADETARILGSTVPSVKNALARARNTLATHPHGTDPANVHDLAASDPAARALVADWVDAFEKGNTAKMVALLTSGHVLLRTRALIPATTPSRTEAPPVAAGSHDKARVATAASADPNQTANRPDYKRRP